MTKPRDESSIEAAVLAVIHHLGIGTVARLVDRGEGTVRHWTDPDHDGRPTAQQCILMDLACAERGIKPPLLSAYVAQMKAAGRAAEPAVGDLLLESLDLSESVGKLHGLVRMTRDLNSPGGLGITPNEASVLNKAVRVVLSEVEDVKNAISQAVKTGKRR